LTIDVDLPGKSSLFGGDTSWFDLR
jgi:hypothetical protein